MVRGESVPHDGAEFINFIEWQAHGLPHQIGLGRIMNESNGSLADALRTIVVHTFYSKSPPEGVRLLYAPDAAYVKALTIEHWQFLQAFPRWCGAIVAKCPHQDVWEYEIDNLHDELIHDEAVGGGHYAIVRQACLESGWADEEVDHGRAHPKMERAIDDWYAIVRERPWVEAAAAVHGTEMLADQRLKKHPDFAMPSIVSDRSFIEQGAFGPATRRWLSTTAADTAHAGRAADLVAKYAATDSTPEAVLRTFRRSMDDMTLYFEAIAERRREILEAKA